MVISISSVIPLIVLSTTTVYLKFGYYSANYSFKNFTDTVKEHGYIGERHFVVTNDGYQLTIFRITKEKICKNVTPVLLMHGVLQSSDSFIEAGPKAGLAYLLSDDCYDVWISNDRGNCYARKHVRLDPDKDQEFWNFSVDELGQYDLPANIDYILNATGSSKLSVIGFSQGGTTALIMCIELPGYCDKINVIISLSPPTRLVYSRFNTFNRLLEIIMYYEKTLNMLGVYEIFPRNGLIQTIGSALCGGKMNIIKRNFCKTFIKIIDAHNPNSMTDDTLNHLYNNNPAGTSVRNLARYGQSMNKGSFRKYDYGEEVNIKKYGTAKPPVYDLKRIKTPVVILHGRNDHMASIIDSEWLSGELPNSELFEVEDPLWNHLDMNYNQHIGKMIFGKINTTLTRYGENII